MSGMGLVNSKLGGFHGYRWFLRCAVLRSSISMFKFSPQFYHRDTDQKTILSLVSDSNCYGNFLSFLFYLIKLTLEGIVVYLVCHNFLLKGKSANKQNCYRFRMI